MVVNLPILLARLIATFTCYTPACHMPVLLPSSSHARPVDCVAQAGPSVPHLMILTVRTTGPATKSPYSTSPLHLPHIVADPKPFPRSREAGNCSALQTHVHAAPASQTHDLLLDSWKTGHQPLFTARKKQNRNLIKWAN